MAKETDENNLKFSIQMVYSDDSNKKQIPKDVVVGMKQSFQVDQFQDGDIYFKEVKFGMIRGSDLMDTKVVNDEPEGSVWLKIQLLRDESSSL